MSAPVYPTLSRILRHTPLCTIPAPHGSSYRTSTLLLSSNFPARTSLGGWTQTRRFYRPRYSYDPTTPARLWPRSRDIQRSAIDPTLFIVGAVVSAGVAYFATTRSRPPTLSQASEDQTLDMSTTETAPGRPGNLTPEQEVKLKEMWAQLLSIFGLTGHSDASAAGTNAATAPDADAAGKKKKRSRLSIFGGRNKSKDDNEDPEADKHNQSAEFEAALTTDQPAQLRAAFWDLVKHDNPDAIVLRYLRARKWDVHNATVMLVSTLHWLLGVDPYTTIVAKGEGDAYYQSTHGTGPAQKDGQEFMDICHAGKSFIHGHDVAGRPVVYIRARLHKSGQQSDGTMERFTIHTIETTRLFLTPQVDTATLVFDMSGFTLANMDYAPVKFMIKCFEANYPESLGSVVVFKAPFIFQGIWKVIKGWLDPVVAGKIHFESSAEALENYIGPQSRIIKELGGAENFEYSYSLPKDGENEVMKDGETKAKIQEERKAIEERYEQATAAWAATTTTTTTTTSNGKQTTATETDERTQLAARLTQNYWRLDPYIRARTLYDRVGVLQPGGHFEHYPAQRIPQGGEEPSATAQ